MSRTTTIARLGHAASALTNDDVFAEILQLLYQLGGIDFSDYKPATIMRRLGGACRRPRPSCTSILRSGDNRDEMLTLRKEMLISVTSFFRDPEAFDLLAEKVIAPLVDATDSGDTIRVWIAGVATGEEAYSIAMLFLEAFAEKKRWPTLKIFATDVDHHAIEKAGVGVYRETIAAEISPERLERFFVSRGDSFVIKNELRQCIVFARQNLLADPPFTKMDLVVCRNTLIYFKPVAQERVLHALLYALNSGGTLFLGSSESVAMMTDALQVVSAKHKLFRRTADASCLCWRVAARRAADVRACPCRKPAGSCPSSRRR
jgi:two-component system CheB/CheR fusion protein